MKKIACLIVLCCSLFGYSQEQDLLAHWQKDDTYDFEVTKVKLKFNSTKITDNDSVTFKTTFKVLEKKLDSYTLQWRYENDILDKLKLPLNVKNSFADFKITEVIYKTDINGAFIEVVNWEAIAQKMATLKKGLLNTIGADAKGNKILLENVEVFTKLYSSKAGIEQLVVRELQAFHFAYGLTYTLKSPIKFTQQLPNMFGGAPVKGEASIEMTQRNEAKKEMQLHYIMNANPEDAKRMINDFLSKLNLEDQQLKKAMTNSSIKMSDDNTFMYDYELGIPNSIFFTRLTNINIAGEKGKQIDKIKIKRIIK